MVINQKLVIGLLVIGTDSHRKVVVEVAADFRFEKIVFLDNNSFDAIGKINEIEKFVDEYKYGFVIIGNNKFR